MSHFFSSGRAVDLVLVFLALEVVVLSLWRRRAWAHAVAAAMPGACLLLALRAALTGADWIWVGLWLALSLPAHLADLRSRPVDRRA